MRKISTVAATRLKATVTDISDEDKDSAFEARSGAQ
jgi:hypothetical protein